MLRKPEKMTEDKLNGFLDSELEKTIGNVNSGGEVSDERERNLSMYLNYPVGDEEEGRSKIQSSDIQDVIEALLPGTLAPFISSEQTVEFEPVGEEDQDQAEEATQALNYIFNVENDGLGIQYTWQKDAYLSKNGFVYADWEERERTKRDVLETGIVGLMELMDDPQVEVIQYQAKDSVTGEFIQPEIIEQMLSSPDGVAMLQQTAEIEFEIEYRRTVTEGRIKVQNIAPEYAIVSKTATSFDSSRVKGWQEQVTISQLREEGYDEELIAKIPVSEEAEYDISGERSTREQAQGGLLEDSDSTDDPASQTVWRTIVWAHVDYDGDGIAELRKIIRAGYSHNSGGKILFNEEVEECPMVDFTAIPMPHQAFGRAIADLVAPLQEAKTAMLRANMDATYHTVYPRYKLLEDFASDDTYDDLLMDIPGMPVRMQRDAVAPLNDTPDLGATYQMLEYLDQMREIRTPVTRQDQGIDADLINDKTATESTIMANASAMKKELIIRLYAERLGKLFKLMLRLFIQHQDQPKLIRLRPNKPPVQVDPRFWNADMDVSVKVGLGTGTRDQQLQSLMLILKEQKELMMVGSTLVDEGKIYNTESRLVELAGLSNPELYWNDPEEMEEQPQPEGPTPEQMEAEKQAQEAQSKMQMEAAKLEQEIALKKEQMALEREKTSAELQAKNEQHIREMEIKLAEIQSRKEMEAYKVQASNQSKREIAEISRQPGAEIRIQSQEDMSGALDVFTQGVQSQTQALMEMARSISQGMMQQAAANAETAGAIDELKQVTAAPKKKNVSFSRDAEGRIEPGSVTVTETTQ